MTSNKLLSLYLTMTNLIMQYLQFKDLLEKQKTWISPNRNVDKFQTDYVAIFRKYSREIQNIKAMRNAKRLRPLSFQIKFKLQPRNTNSQRNLKLPDMVRKSQE